MNIIKFLPTLPQIITHIKTQHIQYIKLTPPACVSQKINQALSDINTYINTNIGILFLNRNARQPKRPNHGARPCSSVMRRLRKKQMYRRWKKKTPSDMDQFDK